MKLGVAGILVSVATIGCAGSFEEARVASPKVHKAVLRDDARCRDLADREAFWSSFAIGAAAAAGAGGLASIPVPDRYQGVPVGAVVLAGVTAAAAKAYGHKLGEAWAKECAQ